jgi:hypothetical protein
MNYPKVLAKCQARMLPQGRNDKDFACFHFWRWSDAIYHLNQAELADKTWAASWLVSNSIAHQVLWIIPRYWWNAKPECYHNDEMTRIFCMASFLEVLCHEWTLPETVLVLNRVSKTSRMSLDGHVDPVRESLRLSGYEGWFHSCLTICFTRWHSPKRSW